MNKLSNAQQKITNLQNIFEHIVRSVSLNVLKHFLESIVPRMLNHVSRYASRGIRPIHVSDQ